MKRILLSIALGGLATACASTGQARIEANTLPPCTTRPELKGWHQVSGDGLTFCVPEDWSSTGARGWHGSEGSIRWGAGERTIHVEERVVTVVVRRGEAPPKPTLNPRIRIAYNTSELVGGVPMDLYIVERDGSFETGASWSTGKPMHMSGKAPTATAADVHMDIYRSVRLEARNQPE